MKMQSRRINSSAKIRVAVKRHTVLNRLTRFKKKYLLHPISLFCLQFSFEQVIIVKSDSFTFLDIMRFSLGRKLIRILARWESSAPRVPSYYDKFAKPEPPGVFKLFPNI